MAEKAKILLVEDESGLVMTLSDRFTAEGYRFEAVSDGLEGYEAALRGKFDLILLDIMLPGKNGHDICRDLRSAGFRIPIIMLTARSQVIDRVIGLKLGADDYICKPFEMAELLARVEAQLRRTMGGYGAEPDPKRARLGPDGKVERVWDKASERGLVQYDGFSMDFAKGVVERGGKTYSLSGQEYKLFAYLSGYPNEIISRDRLLEAVWGYGDETTTRTVDVHVAWLRKKIGDRDPVPRHITTVRGLGYRFIP